MNDKKPPYFLKVLESVYRAERGSMTILCFLRMDWLWLEPVAIETGIQKARRYTPASDPIVYWNGIQVLYRCRKCGRHKSRELEGNWTLRNLTEKGQP